MKKGICFFTLVVVVCLITPSFAQTDDGKIVVEITKEINGEKKTFKGEYNSTEEMYADPNYQEFSGDNNQFHFWSDDGDANAFFHMDHLKDMQSNLFKFFDGDNGNNQFFFHDFDDDSTSGGLNFHFDHFDSEEFTEEFREKMQDLGIEIEALVDEFSSKDGDKRVKIITLKRIEVSEVGDEFGKKGKVNKSDLLELDDLTFYPNPSKNGKIKVRFSTPLESDLSIKVSNLEGKEVFSRNFDRFSGTYSETIDLSRQKEGIYLLEIAQGKKRVTKKLVVD